MLQYKKRLNPLHRSRYHLRREYFTNDDVHVISKHTLAKDRNGVKIILKKMIPVLLEKHYQNMKLRK